MSEQRQPYDIIGFGEAMVLFQPAGGTTLEQADVVGVHVAGAELNLCAAAARLGVRTGFFSRVGGDPLGNRVLAECARLGVDPAMVRVDVRHPTGVFVKDVRSDGQRRVHYYRTGSAASMMDVEDADKVLAAGPRAVAVSGITSALGPGPRDAVGHLVKGARRAGSIVAFDPNLRAALGDIDEQAERARVLLPYVDVLMLGIDEAGPIFGTVEPATALRRSRAYGIGDLVLKAGAEGCYHMTGGPDATDMAHLPSAAANVVDPVGAGDAFAGGYLAARLRGAAPDRAAWLGSRLAAGVVAAVGDTAGLPDAAAGLELLRRAVGEH